MSPYLWVAAQVLIQVVSVASLIFVWVILRDYQDG